MSKHWLKLSPHRHSGRLRSHEHTSYIPLVIVLLFLAWPLIAYTASAATPYTGPEAGSVGLSGVMPGKAPTTGAKITAPANGQHFAASPVTISGTCPADTLVELFKNDIFAGSTACSTNGTFTVEIDLLFGQNTLVARVYDALNQAGPDSNSIIVYYDALPAQSSGINTLDFGGPQLLLNTDAVFRGTFPGQEMSIPLDIIGGTAPYAINIQWGDSTNTIVSRNDNVTFRTAHVYKKAGTYQLSVQASDGNGRVAFLTVAAIVNGQPDTATATTTGSASTTNTLLILWPLYTSLLAIVVSFWLGERREKAVLSKHGLLLAVRR